jgi:hypothetical protein
VICAHIPRNQRENQRADHDYDGVAVPPSKRYGPNRHRYQQQAKNRQPGVHRSFNAFPLRPVGFTLKLSLPVYRVNKGAPRALPARRTNAATCHKRAESV